MDHPKAALFGLLDFQGLCKAVFLVFCDYFLYFCHTRMVDVCLSW